jgi:ATP-dependent DNA ligase
VEHTAKGADLFRVICERNMEGVVAKPASARYTPEAAPWAWAIAVHTEAQSKLSQVA